MKNEKEAELGDRVRDKISGVEGIVTGVTQWLYGCKRLTIQPEKTDNGKPVDSICIDAPQAIIIKKTAINIGQDQTESTPTKKPRHGNRPDASRGQFVKR